MSDRVAQGCGQLSFEVSPRMEVAPPPCSPVTMSDRCHRENIFPVEPEFHLLQTAHSPLPFAVQL